MVYLLGADEIAADRLGDAFVIYQGHHGDRGAARADVILPGAAYTEKDAIYVNTEGRPQRAARAIFPPGEAKEDWRILRALSEALGHTVPLNTLGQVRARLAELAPQLAQPGHIQPATWKSFGRQGKLGARGLRRADRGFLSHRSDQPRLGRHGRVQRAACPQSPSRRPAPMAEFWSGYAWPTIWIVIQILIVLVPLLIAVAYLTYAERKVIAAMQLRQGPMVVGPMGIWQPIADGIKMFVKETVIPTGANKVVFIMAPMVTFILAHDRLGGDPVRRGPGDRRTSMSAILYLFAISSLGVYGIIMAGWASNSRYAFLGALRSAAQMVSYEISIGLIIINVLITAGSLNLTDIVLAQQNLWYFIPHFPMFAIFVVSILAETNRHPFDLPEAEAELVAGYNVEYSAMTFALFFIGEYANMILMSAICAILFLGGWLPPFDIAPFTWIPGPLVADRQDLLRAVHLHLGARHLAALPLRPADAARLEGVPAGIAALDRDHVGLPGRHRPAAGLSSGERRWPGWIAPRARSSGRSSCPASR